MTTMVTIKILFTINSLEKKKGKKKTIHSKLNCLVVKVVLPVPPRTFSSYSNPESDFQT